jgi:hypothetical protein
MTYYVPSMNTTVHHCKLLIPLSIQGGATSECEREGAIGAANSCLFGAPLGQVWQRRIGAMLEPRMIGCHARLVSF